MPAVTVTDLSTLPHVEAPSGAARPVDAVTAAPSGFEGNGFPVRRAFAGVPTERLDPFIHMDQMGEIDYAPGTPKGTPWHPHRGFETVTYLIDGTFRHQDNHGGGGLISDGDTQWMTAGSGILHIEEPPEDLVRTGGLFHGVQLWVNLPAADKGLSPATSRSRPARCGSSTDATAARCCASSRVTSAATPDRAAPTPRSTSSTHRSDLARRSRSPGPRASTRWRMGSPGRAPRATDRRLRHREAGDVRRRRHDHHRAPMPARTRAPATSRCCCSAASRSVSRSPGRAPS